MRECVSVRCVCVCVCEVCVRVCDVCLGVCVWCVLSVCGGCRSRLLSLGTCSSPRVTVGGEYQQNSRAERVCLHVLR